MLTQSTVNTFVDAIKKKYPVQHFELDFFVDAYGRDWIELKFIKIKNDAIRKGYGSLILSLLCAFADKHEANLALTPATDENNPKYQRMLIKFYKQFGFKENKGRNKEFVTRCTYIRYYK